MCYLYICSLINKLTSSQDVVSSSAITDVSNTPLGIHVVANPVIDTVGLGGNTPD